MSHRDFERQISGMFRASIEVRFCGVPAGSFAAAEAGGTRLASSLTVALIALASLSLPTRAERLSTPKTVDLKLVVAVDVSSSMSGEELRLQAQGYVSALRSSDVMQAIKSGRRGRIAIAYIEWARPEYQRVVVPWTIIDSAAEAGAIADEIERHSSVPEGGTSISSALLSAGKLLRTSALESDREIVDISGDGPNNSGPRLLQARDDLVARGVTINGLAISLLDGRPDMIDSFPLDYVVSYYKRCVIGGFGAFVLAVGDRTDFERAIRLKLVSEIAELPERRQLAGCQVQYRVAYCEARGH
jgi:hypothetical protein